jgi:hypothetical protein
MLFIDMIEAQPFLDRTIKGELFDPVLRAMRESPRRENALELLIHANSVSARASSRFGLYL